MMMSDRNELTVYRDIMEIIMANMTDKTKEK